MWSAPVVGGFRFQDLQAGGVHQPATSVPFRGYQAVINLVLLEFGDALHLVDLASHLPCVKHYSISMYEVKSPKPVRGR